VEVSRQWVCCAESFGAFLLFHDTSCFTVCKCTNAVLHKTDSINNLLESEKLHSINKKKIPLSPNVLSTICEQ
jgi:hypothetical protein